MVAEKRKVHWILSVEHSEHMKEFCIRNNIKWFRTEYWESRYFEVTGTQEEINAVQDEIDILFGER